MGITEAYLTQTQSGNLEKGATWQWRWRTTHLRSTVHPGVPATREARQGHEVDSFPLRTSRKLQHCQQLDFRHLASRAVREYISCSLKPPVCGNYEGRARTPSTPPSPGVFPLGALIPHQACWGCHLSRRRNPEWCAVAHFPVHENKEAKSGWTPTEKCPKYPKLRLQENNSASLNLADLLIQSKCFLW